MHNCMRIKLQTKKVNGKRVNLGFFTTNKHDPHHPTWNSCPDRRLNDLVITYPSGRSIELDYKWEICKGW